MSTQVKIIFGVTGIVILAIVVGAVVLLYQTLEDRTISWDQLMEKPESGKEVEEVGVIARQSYWTVWYPGVDGQFGTRDYRLMDDKNMVGFDSEDIRGHDDILVQGTYYLPVNKEVSLNIQSLDVLHCLYIPHFRVKMDAVPGMATHFNFIPQVTTKEMREQLKIPEFEYEMACAEICGRGHFSMHMTLKVVEDEEYRAWLAQQPTLSQTLEW